MRVVRLAARIAAVGMLALTACSTTREPSGRAEPHYKIGEPYRIEGKWYYPREDTGYEAIGVASWYGADFDGRPTANGEIFDRRRLSAAHTTLPLPTLAEVENLENGRRIVVRVNDRGPFYGERLIDVSQAAARALGFERAGLAQVRVRYIGRAVLAERAPLYGEGPPRMARADPPIAPAAPAALLPQPAPTPPSTLLETEPLPALGAVDADLPPEAIAGPGSPAPTAESPVTGEFWIRVATFLGLDDLEKARAALNGAGGARVSSLSIGGVFQYALEIGPFATVAAAGGRLAGLREAGYPEAEIVGGSY